MNFSDEHAFGYQSHRSVNLGDGWAAVAAIGVAGVLGLLLLAVIAVRDAVVAVLPGLVWLAGQLLLAAGTAAGIAVVGVAWIVVHDRRRLDHPPRARRRRRPDYVLEVDVPDPDPVVQRTTARALAPPRTRVPLPTETPERTR